MSSLRPMIPLAGIMPDWLIDWLKQNPRNSMAWSEGADNAGRRAISFFLKTDYSDVQFVIDSPSILAIRGLAEVRDDPVCGHVILHTMRLIEGEENTLAEGVSVAQVEGVYNAASEFPVDVAYAMYALEILLGQESWQYIFVDNECDKFFNAKLFDNPIKGAERERWLYKVRKRKQAFMADVQEEESE